MADRIQRLDQMLGRFAFRSVGILCAIVALICAYAVWSHLTDWRDYSLVPAIMFGVAAVAAGSAVPYCFSRKRTLGEALDAMEGGAGDTHRRTRE